MRRWIIGLAVLGAVGAAQMPKYGVTVTADKHTDFDAFRTYAWTTGWAAMEPELDRQIIATIDRHLTALGMMKVESAPCDVLVAYEWVRRTDIDPKSVRTTPFGLRRVHPVGTLSFLLLDPPTRRQVFRARADAPLDTEPPRPVLQVDAIVAAIFEKYPTLKSDRR